MDVKLALQKPDILGLISASSVLYLNEYSTGVRSINLDEGIPMDTKKGRDYFRRLF